MVFVSLLFSSEGSYCHGCDYLQGIFYNVMYDNRRYFITEEGFAYRPYSNKLLTENTVGFSEGDSSPKNKSKKAMRIFSKPRRIFQNLAGFSKSL